MRLFVYGTLMNPAQFARVSGRKFVTPVTRTLEGWRLLPFGDLAYFPTIMEERGERVTGVVYNVSEPELDRLDRYEGVPRLYHRETIQFEDGPAYVYIQNEVAAWLSAR